MLQLDMGPRKIEYLYLQTIMSITYTKCICFMFLNVLFLKMCSFVNLLLKRSIHVFS